jgi:hypothetical protein
MNNTIEKEKTASSYILGIGFFIAMSMNSEDKIHLHHFISVRTGNNTYFHSRRLNSNFDSLLFRFHVDFRLYTLVLWVLQRNKRKQNQCHG